MPHFKSPLKISVLLSLVTLAAFTLSSFTKNSLASSIKPPQSITDTVPGVDTSIFLSVEEEAYFPGGNDGWREFLINNLNANIPIDKGAPEGVYTVIVQFVVSKDGSLSDWKALTKHGYGMENEVLRIIRKSPRWVAAVQKGRNVNAYRKQPVTFQVVVEKKKKKRGS